MEPASIRAKVNKMAEGLGRPFECVESESSYKAILEVRRELSARVSEHPERC